MSAGDGIVPPPGGFSFRDPRVAEVFDRHVALSVPEYDEVQRLVAALSQWFLSDGSAVVDYGCATGRTLEEIARANPGRNVRCVGVDESEPMCELARRRLATLGPGRAEVVRARISDVPPPPDAGLLVAIYALQFMTIAERADALKMMATARRGTGLVLVEKCVPDDPSFAVPFSDAHHDEKLRAYEPAEVMEKARSLRGVLRPATMRETEDMLREVGWKPQRFWQHLAFVGWVCAR